MATNWDAVTPVVHRAADISVQFDVPAVVRDNTTLRANVYRPTADGPWPVLLTRTPYDKDSQEKDVWCGLNPVQVARQGFIVVIQDVRGRFASDGEWEPFRKESEDGYDTIQWAANLPGSNGRVGMYSASYCGNVQWLAAAARPPALMAISPAFTWADPLDGLFARGGAVELGLAWRWALENSFDTISRRGGSDPVRARDIDSVMHEWDSLPERAYWELPVNDVAVLRRHRIPALGGMRAIDNAEAATWSSVCSRYGDIAIPSLHTAGWYDIFLQGTLDNFTAMAGSGLDAQLVVGPWTHQDFGEVIGQRDFGMRAARHAIPASGDGDPSDFQLAWFRRYLAGVVPPEHAQALVRIFVMGRNEWRSESSWPPSRAVPERWYVQQDGSLATASPAYDSTPSEFVYDPAQPVPTLGGNGVLWPGYPSGPIDQAPTEARPDVVVFTSPPLARDLEVTGRVKMVLYCDSSAPATDWVARLCDVDADGRSFNVCDGIVRVTAGSAGIQRREIDLWSTSIAFLAGHRIRVHITSSSFPRWDRNLNTGDQNEKHWIVARQRIYHNAEHASYIELPVIPGH